MAFAHNGSVEIYYETFGDASNPALLLINGLGSQCINFDVEFCEMFVARGFFVIRFDNRDVGLSTKFNSGVTGSLLGARGGERWRRTKGRLSIGRHG